MYKLDENNQAHRDLIRSFLLEADPIGYYDPHSSFHNEYDYCIDHAISLINLQVPAVDAARALLERMLGSSSEDESTLEDIRDFFESETFQSRLRKLVGDFQDFLNTLFLRTYDLQDKKINLRYETLTNGTTPMNETITPISNYLVHFVHGKESGPWGSKITRLAQVAISLGFQVESLDYAGMEVPEERADKLIQNCADFTGNLVLVGSSMGGWVATRASLEVNPIGLFLLAPAFLLPGYSAVQPGCSPDNVEIVHGWDDDVILYEHSVRVGRDIGCTVHLVKDDHRLQNSGRFLDDCFRNFLVRLLNQKGDQPGEIA